MTDLPWVILVAIGLDTVLGDPDFRFHPVRLIGKVAVELEKNFRHLNLDGILGGALFCIVHLVVTMGAVLAFRSAIYPFSRIATASFDALVLFFMYAHRDLIRHAQAVYQPLKQQQLDVARQQVSRIVGRDTVAMDRCGIARATIESVAENFVDGAFGILLWFVAAIPIAKWLQLDPTVTCVAIWVMYRSVNTLDAMVGYRTEPYEKFGKFCARLDDGLNFVPARLSVVPLLIVGVVAGGSAANGVRAWYHYRKRIASPNSGHPESVMAGLLNVRLGGPSCYNGECSNHGWIWENGREADAGDIRRCIRIVNGANGLTVAVVWVIGYLVTF